jgi:type IV pilus assembly protein PilW
MITTSEMIGSNGGSELAKRSRGFTIVELMVALALGLLLAAGMAYLIAGMSASRTELEKFNQQIESGRYGLQVMSEDLRLAGFYGVKSFSCEEIYGDKTCASIMPPSMLSRAGGLPSALPSPCQATVANWVTPANDFETYTANHLLWAIQGYNNVTAGLASCLADGNVKPGTDILVIRRQSTDPVVVASAVANQPYIQSGSSPGDADRRIKFRLATAPSTSFDLQMKQQGTAIYQTTNVSRIFLHIYFISPCSRPAGAVCAASDDGIPTLKRLELSAGGFQMVTIAEGIEDMNIEYGVDADRDGSADGAFKENPSVTEWWDVTAVRVNLLARNNQSTPGYQESKQFDLGVGRSAISFTGANAGFKRHVYSELVRVNNVSMRRE